MASFGFILSRSPYKGSNLLTLYSMAAAALEKKHEVFIYLNYDGVYSSLKNQKTIDGLQSPKDYLSDLIQKGAVVMSSSLDTRIRGLDSSKTFLDGIKTGGLSDVSEIISSVDKLITL